MITGANVIESLEKRLSELSHILYVMGKEYGLFLEHSDDEDVRFIIGNGIAEIKSAENGVANLLDAIVDNRDPLAKEWFNNPESISELQIEVERLEKSIDTMLRGNETLVSKLCKN